MIPIPAKKLEGFMQTFCGLMFTQNITPVYFETRFGIHTFFVKTPIDIVILDSNGVVKKVKHNLKPWRIYLWNPSYFRVLELPQRTIKNKKIKKGTKIKIIEQ